jgi:hypothetical protein
MVAIHGFGGWAAGKIDNDNNFLLATKDWELNNYYFSLNLTAQPAENVSINAQMFWGQQRHDQMLDLDYIFAQYFVSPELIIRLGKVKSPFGLYAEIYDVGTLRPFYLLPVGMYRGMFPKSYVGLGITGEYEINPDLSIVYDLVGGEMAVNGFDIEIPELDFSQMPPVISGYNKMHMTPVMREVIGANVDILPMVEGLKAGVSFMTFKFNMRRDGGAREEAALANRHWMVTPHLEFLYDNISLRAEAYFMRDSTVVDGGYVEAAYTLYDHWQVAASYDFYENKTPSTAALTPKNLLKHSSVGLGLNYWFNPNLVLKANYYMITDNAFAQPDIASGKTLAEKTKALIIGTQFSF